ncbi:hypothetical protein [Flammeovirga kamogawensis]|uniref:Uncharacterized protein n=1 Tax=Flammeovirga kamogawensis TaxID=373891 RepID=A0ABX8GQM1_9BACT|nr:hypothetical protein [Flammeovirga kamogawensis]MBB6463456.1 hypothetical protein [Flammeovirga kamogawensis]QWG05618.1 hypothetical protein KM029_09500 [Flammeovirga kamogawensis]TRX67450.1 hypothetical protein EO216_04540 [Flammeovirga kamogawensis]
MGQDIRFLDKGTLISIREQTLRSTFIRVPNFNVCKENSDYDLLNTIYFRNCVYKDSIRIFGKINPSLFVVTFTGGYGVISLNEEKEVIDLEHISYYSGMDSDEMISKVVDDTTLRVTYLDGYKRRVEKYTLVQRDGLFVKKDSSFTEPLPTFDEWEVFFGHYEYDED